MKKQVTRPVQAHLLRGTFYLLLLLAVCAVPFALAQRNVTKQSLAKLGNVLPPAVVHRTLTFAERVSYQRGIEEVYWRHRIWPKANAGAKPPLDEVMSQAEIEKKVEDYLRNSQALEDHWQRPITADQLQAEMERMARDTKQPEVLQELFEALGNDPFVIAECLARPVLVERFANSDFVAAAPNAFGALSKANYTLPVIAGPSDGCIDDTWTATSINNAPSARSRHTAVWTGSEMIVWGGGDQINLFDTGARYNPSTDSWTATSNANAPAARSRHTAVWTGSEMIVWGGGAGGGFNSGGRYNPSTDSWTATATASAPTGRFYHTAVWTGSEMIVWGGCTEGFCTNRLNTGGRYDPSTDSWTATSNAPAARWLHTAVWTGSEMIVWGGLLGGGNSGGKYNPITDSWTATSTTNAPTGRNYHTAVWTGSEMIVWGGQFGGILNTGGKYDPITDSWTATTNNNAPEARRIHTAVWTGSEMIVWGGADDSLQSFNTGGRYDPGTDSWTATSTTKAPSARYDHTAVWTDSEMIVWAGLGGSNTGGRYCAAASSPTPTPTPSPTPTATATPTATTTPRPSPTPRIAPTPRVRPTSAPRP